MTTLTDRAGTTLLVVDVQMDVDAGAHARDQVVPRHRRSGRTRTEGVTVVWVQHADDEVVLRAPQGHPLGRMTHGPHARRVGQWSHGPR